MAAPHTAHHTVQGTPPFAPHLVCVVQAVALTPPLQHHLHRRLVASGAGGMYTHCLTKPLSHIDEVRDAEQLQLSVGGPATARQAQIAAVQL